MGPEALRPRSRVVGKTQGVWDLGGRGLTLMGSELTLVLRGVTPYRNNRLPPEGPAQNSVPTGSSLPRVAHQTTTSATPDRPEGNMAGVVDPTEVTAALHGHTRPALRCLPKCLPGFYYPEEPGGPAAETCPVCCSGFLLLREAGRSGSGNLPGLLL